MQSCQHARDRRTLHVVASCLFVVFQNCDPLGSRNLREEIGAVHSAEKYLLIGCGYSVSTGSQCTMRGCVTSIQIPCISGGGITVARSALWGTFPNPLYSRRTSMKKKRDITNATAPSSEVRSGLRSKS
jgi:hypothetical protein